MKKSERHVLNKLYQCFAASFKCYSITLSPPQKVKLMRKKLMPAKNTLTILANSDQKELINYNACLA